MSDKLLSNKLFDKLGVRMSYVSSTDTESFDFYAFLPPLRYKNKLYLSGVPTELGFDGLNKYLLICDPSIDMGSIDGINYRLTFGKNAYGVDHHEIIYRMGKPFYMWAIIHREG
ncbi:MAG: hypothetical protein IJC79_06675 [Clostridia bacterium]|nr:hypothetical protein [Clostridia bacterium]